jgi:serine/threonine protein kinase
LFHLNNELSILKELSHTHLVKVIGGYVDSKYAHIIISLVADQDLADRLFKSLGQMQIVQWIESLAFATSYLHGKGIRHLDIKPQNILLKGDTILSADFGTELLYRVYRGSRRRPGSHANVLRPRNHISPSPRVRV